MRVARYFEELTFAELYQNYPTLANLCFGSDRGAKSHRINEDSQRLHSTSIAVTGDNIATPLSRYFRRKSFPINKTAKISRYVFGSF